MKAVIQNKFGDASVLIAGEAEKPKAETNQVIIKVEATTINRADIIQREGNYNQPPGDSPILGLEVAGIINELGSGVTDYQTGERVMSLVGGGGYAEYAAAYANHLIKIPDSMSFEEAACVCETYITAYLNVFMLGRLKNSETVLLHGGGGGVNTAGIQLCKTLMPNVKIIVTASPGKIHRVESLGADHVINYKETDFADAIRNITNKKGINVILDHIGGGYLTQNLKCLAVGGRLVIIGLMGGNKSEVNLGPLMVKRQQIIGSVLRSRTVDEKTTITKEFSQTVLPLFSKGLIKPLIHQILPLEDVGEGHRIMEASQHFGKIVLTL
ncbi:MAG: NADPH:quinone oxidoreductase [Rhodospirillaceae bacterium]|nr:NADPH:quinone oxidoreductase [Rhodospirillaceae bacterium]|tara:strand:- start:2446 stop:3426 length:981 start_codon:yes stop_codon:yes gene_type:complete